ncbi:MAG: NAD(P)-dependent oxidoreductase [Candidatus Micrarchaeota archaeon]|nr:NAD(P)-dependent oxidoreductase [Candidatus Micrarchaeota archaeon]
MENRPATNPDSSMPRPSKVSFVTGANGKTGKELIKMLLKRGDKVHALVKRKEYILQLPPGVIPFLGDINDINVLKDACKGVDNVYHLAAIVSEYQAGTEEIMRVNVEGTHNIMEACASAKVKHVIFLSSLDVYGHSRRELLTEESKLEPRDRYGLSKVLAEKEILKYTGIVPFTIFRLGQIYGPGFEHYFFKFFRVIRDQKAYIIGDGKNELNLIHVEDALHAMILAASTEVSRYKIYNLTDGKAYTQIQLFNFAADILKVPRPSRHISRFIVGFVAKQRGIDSDELRFLTSNRHVDITKIKRELGFSARVSLEDGAGEFVKQFLDQGTKENFKIGSVF